MSSCSFNLTFLSWEMELGIAIPLKQVMSHTGTSMIQNQAHICTHYTMVPTIMKGSHICITCTSVCGDTAVKRTEQISPTGQGLVLWYSSGPLGDEKCLRVWQWVVGVGRKKMFSR